MNTLIAITLLVVASMPLSAVGEQESPTVPPDPAEPATLSVVVATGTPAVSMSYLVSEDPQVYPGIDLEYEVVNSLNLLSARVLSGEADVIVATTDLGAKLRGRDVDIRYVGSAVWGMLYVVTTEDLDGWDDLRGREIKMLGRGLAPDIVLRYLLESNGLDPDSDVTLDYVQATTELAPTFISGASTISIMPEPALSMVLTRREDA